MRRLGGLLVLGATLAWGVYAAADDKAGPLTLVDEAGNELKFKSYKFTTGLKALPWVLEKAPAGKDPKPEPAGPAFLEFREERKPVLVKDVTTYLAPSCIKQIDYDHAKNSMTLTYLGSDGKDSVLKGPTNYIAINKFSVDGALDPAALKFGAALQLHDGTIRLKSLKFTDAKAGPAPSGRKAVVIRDKDKSKHEVLDLVAIYKTAGGERKADFLMFQKTVKITLSQMTKLVHLPSKTGKGVTSDYEVYLSDGTKQGLTLLTKTTLDEKDAELVGLAGKIPGGYKLFPPSIINEVTLTKLEQE